jgi:hypothetical protein
LRTKTHDEEYKDNYFTRRHRGTERTENNNEAARQ